MATRKRPETRIGWREWIILPDLCAIPIKIKADTGAQTSALHAFRLKVSDQGGTKVASFVMHPHQRSIRDSVRAEAEIIGFKSVRSSNGRVERRPTIRTTAILGDVTLPLDVTLTRRDEMGFRMLLGRAAMRRRFVVDPGRSFIVSPKNLGSMT